MIRLTTDNKLYIEYEARSAEKFWTDISTDVIEKFGSGPFEIDAELNEIYFHVFNACIERFLSIIGQRPDLNFVKYLNLRHEDSFDLYKRTLDGEDLKEVEGIDEADLALNRRILKLALEQSCDVLYTGAQPCSEQLIASYVEDIEDILYLGAQIYSIAETIAELKIVPNIHELTIENGLLNFKRKGIYDDIFQVVTNPMIEGFAKGFFDEDFTTELREQLQNCMSINYDFAGELIFKIQQHHSPKHPEWQTIDPTVLPTNLVANGVAANLAEIFYNGLTISDATKLNIRDAVYKPHDLRRFLYRPILIINTSTERRAIVGKNKWIESIISMGANGFQWQQAPAEWMTNDCFKSFIQQKFAGHDKLLEDKVQEVLEGLGIPFERNVKSFMTDKGQHINIEVPGVGEMDFVFINRDYKKIIIADCKYNRSRYEMVGFSNDYSNFQRKYEPKIDGKVAWATDSWKVIEKHFLLKYPKLSINLSNYSVEGMFIINTPTFYSINGRVKTISWFDLEAYYKRGCEMPVYMVGTGDKRKKITHPYFQ